MAWYGDAMGKEKTGGETYFRGSVYSMYDCPICGAASSVRHLETGQREECHAHIDEESCDSCGTDLLVGVCIAMSVRTRNDDLSGGSGGSVPASCGTN